VSESNKPQRQRTLMDTAREVHRDLRRNLLCRMAGNIAAGLVTPYPWALPVPRGEGDLRLSPSPETVALVAVAIAEAILARVERES
jgi:hypothetical protein